MSQGPLRQNTPGECVRQSLRRRGERRCAEKEIRDPPPGHYYQSLTFLAAFLPAARVLLALTLRAKEGVENFRFPPLDAKSFIITKP